MVMSWHWSTLRRGCPYHPPETQTLNVGEHGEKNRRDVFIFRLYLACFRNSCCFCPGWLLFFRLTLLEEHIVAWQWWKMSLLLDGVPVSMFHGVYQPYHVLLECYYIASFRPDGMVSQGACVWGAEECFQTTSGSRHNLKNRKAVSVCQGA